ncbi:hypothetical protein N0Q91_11575 [Sinorhizobium sp. K101]|uniref:hypothetical protein n=1 Tax=Sinorhizobium sp. K101 TaxID=2976820 RepID=UPI0023D8C3CD|nr:hypothetical protein [Sinorhizobium sp. K101]WEJ14228.1 hypothetical protein N0Q91_11575 [Sinorhizobium sp. K101]
MEKFSSWLIGIVTAAIAYGYWDANAETRADGDLRAQITTPWGLYFDSHADYLPIDNGQLFVEVKWRQPDNRKRISSIRVKGRVLDGAELVAMVDSPCQRAGSTWLGDAKWSFEGQTSTDLVCFIKIDKILTPTAPDGLVRMDEANARIANMRIDYTADVKAVNKPMRYVIWLNEHASKVYEAVSAPFERE